MYNFPNGVTVRSTSLPSGVLGVTMVVLFLASTAVKRVESLKCYIDTIGVKKWTARDTEYNREYNRVEITDDEEEVPHQLLIFDCGDNEVRIKSPINQSLKCILCSRCLKTLLSLVTHWRQVTKYWQENLAKFLEKSVPVYCSNTHSSLRSFILQTFQHYNLAKMHHKSKFNFAIS